MKLNRLKQVLTPEIEYLTLMYVETKDTRYSSHLGDILEEMYEFDDIGKQAAHRSLVGIIRLLQDKRISVTCKPDREELVWYLRTRNYAYQVIDSGLYWTIIINPVDSGTDFE